jgi:gamma-glutamylcyclotransferase (GGCT)/AIG2-like uncharacterized protein YtfP
MLNSKNRQYLALYGSLMQSMGGLRNFCQQNELKFIDQCQIKGCLYDLGDYPGLVLGGGSVIGELYQVTDHSILKKLDAYERFYPDNQKNSLYLRIKVELIHPDQHAWVYAYNQPVDSAEKIESGDWCDFTRSI